MNVIAAIHDTGMTHFFILERNSNAIECVHFIDRLQIPADAIIVLDNVRFHDSA